MRILIAVIRVILISISTAGAPHPNSDWCVNLVDAD